MRTSSSTPRSVQGAGLALLAALALVVAACGGSDDNTDSAQPTAPPADIENVQTGGRLVVGLDSETDGYNPTTNRFAHSGHTVASAIYDTLATIDADGEAVPYLAESIEPNDDFTEWTVTLPEGIEFHDGSPLTAAAIVEVWEFHQTGLVTSSSLTDLTEIEAVDDLTVVFHTARPWASFPFLLTTQVGYVMAPSMLTEPDSGSLPVGTGPFKLDSWDRGTSWTGVRFDKYWQTDENGVQLPYVDQIEFRFIPDPTARQEALESGDIDLMHTLTPESILELRDSDFEVIEWDRGEEDIISLQTEVPPFDNKHARLALAYATDQQRFIDEIQNGVYLPANGPMAPGQLGFLEDTGYPEYDPDKAADELALYKADTGQDLAFTYTGSDDVANLEAQQFLVDMWSQVGITATIEAMTQADVIFTAVTGDYQAIDWRNWGQTDPDPDYLWWHSSSVRPLSEGISVNVAHFADDAVDEALETGRGTVNQDARAEAYAVIGTRFAEEVPYILLGRVVWMMAGAENVHNWQAGASNGTISTLGSKNWLAQIWLS
jgi:peptide/nickel transport system substrate-binding protein